MATIIARGARRGRLPRLAMIVSGIAALALGRRRFAADRYYNY